MLPFTVSGEAIPDYLVQAIPEEVRAGLSTIPGMRVIGRESSGYYQGRTASTTEIGRALEVAWLLLGSLDSAGDDIQTTAQLVNTMNGEVAWEQEFPATDGDITRLGPDIANGEMLQLLVPGGFWKATQLQSGDYGLLSEAVCPGFDYEDMSLALGADMQRDYPDLWDQISAYCKI